MRLFVDGHLRWDVPNTRDYSPQTGQPQPALRIGSDSRSNTYSNSNTHGYNFGGYMDNFVITSARLNT